METAYGIAISIILMLVGLFIFRSGFLKFRAKRFVEDIPSTPIRTGAVGTYVEVKGQVLVPVGKSIRAPITESNATYYELKIFQKLKGWKYFDGFESSPGLFIKDKSNGVAFVSMVGYPDIYWKGKPATLKIRSKNFDQLPPHLSQTLLQKEKEGYLKNFSLTNSRGDFRFEERVFKIDDLVYVLGYCWSGTAIRKNLNPVNLFELVTRELGYRSMKTEDIKFSMNMLKKNKENLQLWSKQFLRAYGPKTINQILPKTRMIFGFNSDKKLVLNQNPIISNLPEDEVRKRILKGGWLNLVLGPIFSIFGLIALLKVLEIL